MYIDVERGPIHKTVSKKASKQYQPRTALRSQLQVSCFSLGDNPTLLKSIVRFPLVGGFHVPSFQLSVVIR